jgi:ParB family transcriptional regulator, chromosome partitioning protein
MARKNIFESVMREDPSGAPLPPPVESGPITRFGAAKSLSSSIDELAQRASMLVEGQTIVDLDPALVDASFVTDRMSVDDESYLELLAAIKARGQDSPVLVRPHPAQAGRYQVVFGHRRLKVARELGRPLRAVVKSLADIEHVLAQGQENAARANLSFIERVLFAQKLSEQNYEREIIQSALSVDYQTLSKMLTIPKVISLGVIEAIGPAHGVGRDRWLDLRKLIENPQSGNMVNEAVATDEFKAANSAERFQSLFNQLTAANIKKPVKKALATGAGQVWAPLDKSVSASISKGRNSTTLILKSKCQSAFGDYLSQNLDRLYEDFKALESPKG